MLLANQFIAVLVCCCALRRVQSACTDEVDNVLTLKDCGDKNSLIEFHDLKILTYDANKEPKCFLGSAKEIADVILPGHLKISSGSIKIKEPLDLEKNSATLLFTLEKNSWVIGTVCQDGESKSMFLKENDCRMDFCKMIGSQFCSMMSAEGVFDIPSLIPEFLTFIPLPAISSSTIEGQWKGDLNIQYDGRKIGCLRVPGNGHWIELRADSEKTEL